MIGRLGVEYMVQEVHRRADGTGDLILGRHLVVCHAIFDQPNLLVFFIPTYHGLSVVNLLHPKEQTEIVEETNEFVGFDVLHG